MTNNLAELPSEVCELFAELITRPDVQSVSFPFQDENVWRMFVAEQVCRARQTGLHLQHAFGLTGPDSGLPFDTALLGGYVHIPYEGTCGGDLFVKPPWRGFMLNAAMGDGDWTAAMLGKSCHTCFSRENTRRSIARPVLSWMAGRCTHPRSITGLATPFLSANMTSLSRFPVPLRNGTDSMSWYSPGYRW